MFYKSSTEISVPIQYLSFLVLLSACLYKLFNHIHFSFFNYHLIESMPLLNQLSNLKEAWSKHQQHPLVQSGPHVQEEVLAGECSPSPILSASPGGILGPRCTWMHYRH